MTHRDVAVAISNEQMAVLQNIHGHHAAAAYHWELSSDAYRRLGNAAKADMAAECAERCRAKVPS